MKRRPKGNLIAYVDKALSIKNYDDGYNYLSKESIDIIRKLQKLNIKQFFSSDFCENMLNNYYKLTLRPEIEARQELDAAKPHFCYIIL